MLNRLVYVAVIAAFGWGCGHESAATQQVRSAASVDLECDASTIEFIDDSPMRKQVTGCGRTLTYMYRCNAQVGGGSSCQWTPVRDDSNKL